MQQRKSEWQLVFFTILTQMAVGTFIIWGLTVFLLPSADPLKEGLFPTILLLIVLLPLAGGTLSAGLHLGRPLHALFSIINLKSSWLSREALLGGSYGLVVFILSVRLWLKASFSPLDRILITGGIILGLGLVYGISRLYMLRTVPAWNNIGTPATFMTTTFLLGTLTVTTFWFLFISWDTTYFGELPIRMVVYFSTMLILLFFGLQFGIFILQLLFLNFKGGAASNSSQLLWNELRAILIWRLVTALLGAVLLVTMLISWLPLLFSTIAFALILVSEILGRFLFYGFYTREGI